MERKIGLFSRARRSNASVAPRVPVDRVVRVLEEVRARLGGEAVGGPLAHAAGHASRRVQRSATRAHANAVHPSGTAASTSSVPALSGSRSAGAAA